jgi:hypothetical protein
VIYIGIDDTDIIGSPGTNQLARRIVLELGAIAKGSIVCRHQLFFDPRIPYTSGNGSASIQLPRGGDVPRDELLDTIRSVMRDWFVEGSDPGLALATNTCKEMDAFAQRARSEVVNQAEAREVAERAPCHLEGLGGTNQGIIGALSAVALVAGGNDGRVVHLDTWPWPDEFVGVQSVRDIRARGIAEIRTEAGSAFAGDAVDVGKHLRPNWRGGQMVLFVEPSPDAPAVWRACKIK